MRFCLCIWQHRDVDALIKAAALIDDWQIENIGRIDYLQALAWSNLHDDVFQVHLLAGIDTGEIQREFASCCNLILSTSRKFLQKQIWCFKHCAGRSISAFSVGIAAFTHSGAVVGAGIISIIIGRVVYRLAGYGCSIRRIDSRDALIFIFIKLIFVAITGIWSRTSVFIGDGSLVLWFCYGQIHLCLGKDKAQGCRLVLDIGNIPAGGCLADIRILVGQVHLHLIGIAENHVRQLDVQVDGIVVTFRAGNAVRKRFACCGTQIIF